MIYVTTKGKDGDFIYRDASFIIDEQGNLRIYVRGRLAVVFHDWEHVQDCEPEGGIVT